MSEAVAVRRVTVERRSYSRVPWRLVDSLTGCELTRSTVFDHPDLGPMSLQEAGFDTKQAAIDHLGVLAGCWLSHYYGSAA